MNNFLGMITCTANLRYECRGQEFKMIGIFDLGDFFHEVSKREILRHLSDGEIEDFIKSCNIKSFASVNSRDVFNNNELIEDEIEDMMEKFCMNLDVDDPMFEVEFLSLACLKPEQLEKMAKFKMYDESIDSALSDKFKNVKTYTKEILDEVSIKQTTVISYKSQSSTNER